MKKVIALVLAVVLVLSLSGCSLIGGVVDDVVGSIELPDFLGFLKPDPYKGMTEAEKLVAVGEWEKRGAPSASLTFYDDGTCDQLNNGWEYDVNWSLDGDTMYFEIVGWEDIVYHFEMDGMIFSITNVAKGTTAWFVPKGTQLTELPENGANPKELVGEWISDDTTLYAWVFDSDGTGYRFDPADSSKEPVNELEWSYDKKTETLYIYSEDWSDMIYYKYDVSNGVLTLQNQASGSEYEYNKQ